jgi:AcrR family transcriptional regulator
VSWHAAVEMLSNELSRRERIMRSLAQLVGESGYAKLTIPAISARSGTSNQTFYEEFGSKRDAFLATFDALADSALASAAAAFAAIAYLELPMIGRTGLERIDALMDRLQPLFTAAPPGISDEPGALVNLAVVGGIWGSIRHGVMTEPGEQPADLLAQIARFARCGAE